MPASNPFATRFTRPGAMEFVFAEGISAAALVAELEDSGWWGQIVGPHGSGKSTLLAALFPEIEARGRQVKHIALRQGETALRLNKDELTAATQLVIDGFEQLSWLARRRVKSRVRATGCGLLVTAHADVGLPTIYEMQPTRELVQGIVRRLLPPGDATIATDDVAAAFERTGGNVRETLFALFDIYQARKPREPRDSGPA